MKKIVSSGLIAVALVFATVAFAAQQVHAETPTLAVRCATAQTRLNTLMTKVETTRSTQAGVYADVQGKVDAIVTSATATSYDNIVALTTAQTEYQAKVKTYTTAATTYSDSLVAAKNLTCGESDGDFAKAVVKARADLVTLRAATAAVRSYVKLDLSNALKDYATWLTTNANETITQ